jgi:hypothetical protein
LAFGKFFGSDKHAGRCVGDLLAALGIVAVLPVVRLSRSIEQPHHYQREAVGVDELHRRLLLLLA